MKCLRSIFIVCVFSSTILAQEGLRFGVKISPSMAWSRISPEKFVEANGTKNEFSGDGLKLRFGGTIIIEYFFSDNYAFTTGIGYVTNSSGYSVVTTSPTSTITTSNNYNLSYLQLPIGFKVVTNEVTDAMKIYFQPGLATNLLVGTRVNGESEYQVTNGGEVKNYSSLINTFAFDLNFSTGIEYELAGNLKLIVGVTYSRGLLSASSSNSPLTTIYKDASIFNDYLSLDLGIKF